MKPREAAQRDFERARRKAFWNELLAYVTGRAHWLLSWDQVSDKLHLGGPVCRSIRTVPVSQIVGSVARYQDFDRAFLPRRPHMQRRWESIARAYYQDTNLPPVRLYQLGDAYFVLDGHHRVSFAKEKGLKYIHAVVVEVESRIPVTADLDADALEIKGEYLQFLERTRLDEVRPEQRIEFTVGGAYQRLVEQIALHRHLMGQGRQRPVPEEEAVCDWYDHVYLPLVQLIRDKDILAGFSGRTEADLYLWIMDHQHALREQCGPDVDRTRATEHYADRHSPHPLQRARHIVQELVSGPDCELLTHTNADAEEPTDLA